MLQFSVPPPLSMHTHLETTPAQYCVSINPLETKANRRKHSLKSDWGGCGCWGNAYERQWWPTPRGRDGPMGKRGDVWVFVCLWTCVVNERVWMSWRGRSGWMPGTQGEWQLQLRAGWWRVGGWVTDVCCGCISILSGSSLVSLFLLSLK